MNAAPVASGQSVTKCNQLNQLVTNRYQLSQLVTHCHRFKGFLAARADILQSLTAKSWSDRILQSVIGKSSIAQTASGPSGVKEQL